MELIVFVFIDDPQAALTQIAAVHLAGHKQSIVGIPVLHHTNGNRIKEGAILIPVGFISGQRF